MIIYKPLGTFSRDHTCCRYVCPAIGVHSSLRSSPGIGAVFSISRIIIQCYAACTVKLAYITINILAGKRACRVIYVGFGNRSPVSRIYIMLSHDPAVIRPAGRIRVKVSKLILVVIYILVGALGSYNTGCRYISPAIHVHSCLSSCPCVCLVLSSRRVIVEHHAARPVKLAYIAIHRLARKRACRVIYVGFGNRSPVSRIYIMLSHDPAVIRPAGRIRVKVSKLILVVIYILVSALGSYNTGCRYISPAIYIHSRLRSAPCVCLILCIR